MIHCREKSFTQLTANERFSQFIPALVEFWKQGRFPINRITHSYSYRDVNKAVDDMKSGHTIKPVLIWEN
jgi:Zn-dependent alcohol dehydrogenase